jgi:hypothetical protein
MRADPGNGALDWAISTGDERRCADLELNPA